VTYRLVRVTKRSVETATKELRLERQRVTAAQTPRVFPAPPIEWTEGTEPYTHNPRHWADVLPVKNGGPGVALNVRARLEWPAPGGVNVETVPTSLAPGDSADLRINWGGKAETDWSNVVGTLTYEDVAHVVWQTDFHITTKTLNRRIVDVRDTIRLAADPAQVPTGKQGPLRRLLTRHRSLRPVARG
jgi:hypothetical protein